MSYYMTIAKKRDRCRLDSLSSLLSTNTLFFNITNQIERECGDD